MLRLLKRLSPIVFLILASFSLQGMDCAGTSDPEDPGDTSDCSAEIAGPIVVPAGSAQIYTGVAGGSWTDNYALAWSVTGPATATLADVDGQEHDQSISFPEPGDYEIQLGVSEPIIENGCGDTEVTLDVHVIAALDECEVVIFGPSTLAYGETGDFQAILGSGWLATSHGTTWEVISGPGTGQIWSPDETSTLIQFSDPGVYTVRVTLESEIVDQACESAIAEFTVTVTDPNATSIPTGVYASPAGAPDGMAMLGGASWIDQLQLHFAMVCATVRGIAIYSLITHQTIEDFSLLSDVDLTNPPLGAAPLAPDSRAAYPALLQFGGAGAFLNVWDEDTGNWSDFGQLIEFQTSVTDAVPLTDTSEALLLVDGYGRVRQLDWNEGNGGYDQSERLTHGTNAASAAGRAADGPLLYVTNGSPGHAYLWHDDGGGFAAMDLGAVGDTPRRIRHLNGIAVATSFASDQISVITWDGAGTAAITATQAVGDGPVGVDLLARAGGGVYALTTGWGDNSYTITEIDGAGAVVASVTTTLPAGCTQPAHGLWAGDADDTFVVSCFGSSKLFVERRVP